MPQSNQSTAHAISPDSGLPWAEEGPWRVADDLYRLPLPLPNDGLRAVNVYVLTGDEGLTLIDGGWAIQESRATLERGLRALGHDIRDIRQFLVTHLHRDHFSLASCLGKEFAVPVALGRGDQPALTLLNGNPADFDAAVLASITAGGAPGLAGAVQEGPARDLDEWRFPDQWLDGVTTLELGQRRLEAIPTPGHTPGHYVFADLASSTLMAGDHVLPTITPSIGFTFPRPHNPLGAFLESLARVRALPDLQLLPAHGPVAPSSHERVEELLTFHDRRLEMSLAALGDTNRTAAQVAQDLPWTRRGRALGDLNSFDAYLAVMETMAHLDVLASRGTVTRTVSRGTNYYASTV